MQVYLAAEGDGGRRAEVKGHGHWIAAALRNGYLTANDNFTNNARKPQEPTSLYHRIFMHMPDVLLPDANQEATGERMLPPSIKPVASSSKLIVPSGACLSERLTGKQNLSAGAVEHNTRVVAR